MAGAAAGEPRSVAADEVEFDVKVEIPYGEFFGGKVCRVQFTEFLPPPGSYFWR